MIDRRKQQVAINHDDRRHSVHGYSQSSDPDDDFLTPLATALAVEEIVEAVSTPDPVPDTTSSSDSFGGFDGGGSTGGGGADGSW